MMQLQSKPLSLPADLQKLYEGARKTYIAGNHREALDIDQRLYEQAKAEKCLLGQIIGRRFVGLCQYRMDMLEASRKSFEAALKLADTADLLEQRLLIRNHLAATMRRLGRLDEAHRLLKEGLEMAPLTQHPHEHARLLGNMGSLLDELGQRAAADDCYARFEVLSRLLGNEHRLANAVGLAARSAELRADHETAEAKYSEEAALAAKVGDPLRRIAAMVHHARMAAHRGESAEAEKGFQDALREAKRGTHKKRYSDALEAYANFLRGRGNLPVAHRLLNEARKRCTEPAEPEKQANIDHSLALVSRDAGLLDESLFYLMRSVETRANLYEPLRTLKDLRKLAQTRLDELTGLTRELVDDAFRISRSADTVEKLKNLVNRVHDNKDTWKSYIASPEHRIDGSPWERDKNIMAIGQTIWSKRLLPGDFEKLSPQSQNLLMRAERSYSSAVDDLGRSAHLLALVLECELRKRLFEKIPEQGGTPWMLGNMLQSLQGIFSATGSSNREMCKLQTHLRPYRPLVERICKAGDPIKPLDGSHLRLVRVRNGVAHGDPKILDSLGRREVDAIKRHLALEAPEGGLTILQALAGLPHFK